MEYCLEDRPEDGDDRLPTCMKNNDVVKLAKKYRDLRTTRGVSVNRADETLPLQCAAGPAMYFACFGFIILWLPYLVLPEMISWGQLCGYDRIPIYIYIITIVVVIVVCTCEWKCMTYVIIPQIQLLTRLNTARMFITSCPRLWVATTFGLSVAMKMDLLLNSLFYGLTKVTFTPGCPLGMAYIRIRSFESWHAPIPFDVQVRISWYFTMCQAITAILSAIQVPYRKNPQLIYSDYVLMDADYALRLVENKQDDLEKFPTTYESVAGYIERKIANRIRPGYMPRQFHGHVGALQGLTAASRMLAVTCHALPCARRKMEMYLHLREQAYAFNPGKMGIEYDKNGFVEKVEKGTPADDKGITPGAKIMKFALDGAIEQTYSQVALANAETSTSGYTVTVREPSTNSYPVQKCANYLKMQMNRANRKILFMDILGHALFLTWKFEIRRLHIINSGNLSGLVDVSILFSWISALKNTAEAISVWRWVSLQQGSLRNRLADEIHSPVDRSNLQEEDSRLNRNRQALTLVRTMTRDLRWLLLMIIIYVTIVIAGSGRLFIGTYFR